MSEEINERALIQHAVEEINIDAPILTTKREGNKLHLFLLGGSGPVTWDIPDHIALVRPPAATHPTLTPDNLQRITGIGRTYAARLIGAGIDTYQALIDADPDQIRAVVGNTAVPVDAWQKEATRLNEQD